MSYLKKNFSTFNLLITAFHYFSPPPPPPALIMYKTWQLKRINSLSYSPSTRTCTQYLATPWVRARINCKSKPGKSEPRKADLHASLQHREAGREKKGRLNQKTNSDWMGFSSIMWMMTMMIIYFYSNHESYVESFSESSSSIIPLEASQIRFE